MRNLTRLESDLQALLMYRGDITMVKVRPMGKDLDADVVYLTLELAGAGIQVTLKTQRKSIAAHRLEAADGRG
jgi:hypothetical protein